MIASRRAWLVLTVALFVLEVLIATVWKHVPVVRADLGDYFVVVLVYAALKSVRAWRPLPLALAVFALGVAVECAQAIGLADILHLEGGARIVLGTTFNWSDVAMYGAGCMTAWLLDGDRTQLREARARE